MLSPLLIIGVGGSGGKTIRAMKQAIKRRLEAERYAGGIPDAWQFLQIDTTYDGLDFPAPMLPLDEFHSVVPSGADFHSIKRNLENLGPLDERQSLLAGWGIAHSDIAIKDGAGQMRGIGRQVGVANALGILQALRNSIGKIQTPTSLAELAEISRLLGSANVDKVPRAFIIASLAGGSGAGMFLDIAELLKRATTDKWASSATSFLYTSEVFESLGEAGANVKKNSLGAMNEIIASKWLGVSDRSTKLFEKLGIPAIGENGKDYGCKANILVGARNASGIDISKAADGTGMDEVFMTIGEALAGVLSDPNIAEFLFQKAFVNIGSMKSAIDSSCLAPELEEYPTLPFAGIGFGRLTLGADRIVDYVADALTRQQIEKLLWPEMNPELLRDGKNRSTLVSEKASEIWPTFLLDSGLDEKGSQNQVIDALYPDNRDNEITGFATQILGRSVSDKPIDLTRFSRNLWSEWETNSPLFFNQMKEKVQAKAQSWVPTIQEKLQDQIAEELVRNGYFVISDLLERLVREIADYAIPELRREHEELAAAVQGFNSMTFSERIKDAAQGLSGVSSENRDFLMSVRKDIVRVLNFRLQSFVCDLASALLADMLVYFFEPLQKELASARFELDDQRRKEVLENGQSNPLKYFPEWGSGVVPSRYKPRTIERILISPDKYEEVYKFYASKDTGSQQPFEKSINFALLGRRLDVNPGEDNPQSLVLFDTNWSTGVRDAQAMGAAATKLQATFHTDLLELSERNRKWLKNDKTTFGQFTNMSIREYVSADGNPELRNEREQQFVAEYSAMLGLSEPLVRLNSNAMNYVLNVDAGKPATSLMRQSSKIPFAASSNVGKKCVEILRARDVKIAEEGFEEEWFDPADNAKTMYATSTTQASLPAWAFESLTAPIAEQAAKAKLNAQLWMQFWDGRRGRPLPEAVPFSMEIRRSIITGWFIARMFGLIEIEIRDVGRGVKIWNPHLDTPGWSNFPAPLLNSHIKDQNRTSWVLPSLLMSAGLAYVEFGGTGSMAPLHGYQLLKFLGREVTTQIDGRDQWDAKGTGDELPTKLRARSSVIADFVGDDKKPAESRELLKLLQEKLSIETDRQAALVSAVQTLQSEYQEAWQLFLRAEWNDLPYTWELKDDIDLALSDIRHYVMNLNLITGGQTSD